MRHKSLAAGDQKIENVNKRLRTTQDNLAKAEQRVQTAQLQSRPDVELSGCLLKAQKAEEKARLTLDKVVKDGKNLAHRGSGKVQVNPLDHSTSSKVQQPSREL